MYRKKKKADELKNEDVVVIAVHASKLDRETLDEWVKENSVSFPVGMIEENEQQIKFAWGVQSLPWLILTDNEHIVTAEGFSVSELDEKIKISAEN